MFCNLNTIKIMKNKLRKGFLVISLGFLFAFGACSEDITQIETPKNEKELKWNTRTFEELKLNSRFLKSYEKVSEKLNKIKTSKNSEYDFVIDSTSIYEVVKDNYTSYTFSIYRNNLPEFVSYYENLFIEIDSSNVPKASILKFNLNPLNNVVSSIEQTTVLENPYLFNKGGLEDDFDDASKCTTVYIYYVETCGCEGQHWPGDPSCDCPSSPPVSVFLNTYETCNTGGTGTGTGDQSTGVITYNPSYTGSGGTYSSTSTAVSNPTNYITQRRKSLRRNLPEGLNIHSENYIWLNSQNESVQGAIYSYLESTVNGTGGLISSVPTYPQEVIAFVNEAINFVLQNNNTPESIEEIMNILEILEDGNINNVPVLISPNNPITDMADYLSCFNTSQGAEITIYADQPKAGSHNLFSTTDGVGHAFISIKQGNNIASLGFYPQCSPCSLSPNPATLNPVDFLSVQGVFGNDEGHSYDVSFSIPINSTSLSNLINEIISVAGSNPLYNLGSQNCTDLAILFFESQTNFNIPSCESPSPWSGQTPGTLGEVIRDLQPPSGGTKNVNGGTSPSNNCN